MTPSWCAAEWRTEAATAMGGYLATTTSAEENAFLVLTRPRAATKVGRVSDPTPLGRDGVLIYMDARTARA